MAKVASIFCTKGGVGKTFIAANLAAALRVFANQRVALLELNSRYSDAKKMLGSSGVHYIAEQATVESVPELIARLHDQFDLILIDAGSVLTRLVVEAFEQSNLILVVTTPDATAIRHAQESLDLLGEIKLPLRMVGMVINRAESRGSLRSIEVKTNFIPPVVAEIPSDGRLAGIAVNRGLPLAMMEEASRIKEAFRRFTQFLLENDWLFVGRISLGAPPLSPEAEPVAGKEGANGHAVKAKTDPLDDTRRRIHAKMIERFDIRSLDLRAVDDPDKAAQLRERVRRVALELITEEAGAVPDMAYRERMVKDIVDEVLGLGPLEDLMADPEISDILVNGKDKIYIERRGKLHRTDKHFLSNDQVLVIIERIIAPLGRRIDESSPMVDARLSDGSRFNAIIPPLSVTGPMLSIRKFSRQRYRMKDLVKFESLSQQMTDFLAACVRMRKNIIVSGGTGSGKTTLLNALSSYIPSDERIITIEDSAELRLDQEHWVPLEARPANIEGRGDVSVRHLFRNTLRMRPDRIIIGECRSDETLDMLQAMNTGHDGSMTTLHANSPEDVIARLDSLILMSQVDLPVRAIREQIASAIHLIVHSARLSDGTRKITHITELTGMSESSNNILLKDIFVFKQTGVGPKEEVIGNYVPTGYVPSFLEDFRRKGVSLDAASFQPAAE